MMTVNLFAQDEGFLGWNYFEIFIITRGLSSSQTIRYKMEAQSVVWTKPDTNPPSNYSITNTLNLAYYPPLSQSETWNTLTNTSIFAVGGFNFIGGNNQVDPYPMESYGYGLYKVSTIDGTAYFYIDYRDNRYRNYTYATGHPQDIWIRFNALSNQFSFRNSGPDMQNLDSSDWTNISNGDHLSIWELKNQVVQGSPQTDQFPNYWSNCLVVFPKRGQDNILVPHLVWGPIPGFTANGYKIYWSLGSPYTFGLLATVGPNTHRYTHEGLAANGSKIVYYKVKAFNESTESNFTNTALINVSGHFFKENHQSHQTNNLDQFALFQNYPNPFNPSTKISNILPEDNFVKLKLYDLLGNEVLEIVNEVKSKGFHEVDINLSQLTSGLYFYNLNAGQYSSSRKLILLK